MINILFIALLWEVFCIGIHHTCCEGELSEFLNSISASSLWQYYFCSENKRCVNFVKRMSVKSENQWDIISCLLWDFDNQYFLLHTRLYFFLFFLKFWGLFNSVFKSLCFYNNMKKKLTMNIIKGISSSVYVTSVKKSEIRIKIIS